MTPRGPVDYVLFADGKVVGSVEAKAEGHTLRSVEAQTDRYNDGFKEAVAKRPGPAMRTSCCSSTSRPGTETLFTSRRDPVAARPRGLPLPPAGGARRVGAAGLHASGRSCGRCRRSTPRACATSSSTPSASWRSRSQTTARARSPPSRWAAARPGSRSRSPTGCCASPAPRASCSSSTESRSATRRRRSSAPTPTRTGAGSTTTTSSRCCAPATSPRRRTSSSAPSSACTRCCAATSASTTPTLDEVSSFEVGDGPPVEVAYNTDVPVEFFDLIYTDECHRSIYGRWGQVLDYFDAFTGRPDRDPDAVDARVLRRQRHRRVHAGAVGLRRRQRRPTAVPHPHRGRRARRHHRRRRVGQGPRPAHARHAASSSSATSIRTRRRSSTARSSTTARFARSCAASRSWSTTKLFPDRDEVPKTIFFCKHDQHAEDVLKVIREVFDRGNDFAKKITYKAEGTVEQNVQEFRSRPAGCESPSPSSRLGPAPTSRPSNAWCSCAWSARACCSTRCAAARSAPWTTTTSGRSRPEPPRRARPRSTRCSWTRSASPTRTPRSSTPSRSPRVKPSVPLQEAARDIGMGLTDDDTLEGSAALRLRRLNNKLADSERDEFEHARRPAT